MGRIVLSAPVNRSDEAESVIVEFRLYPTDELLAAAGRGDIPGFLLPGVNIGSPISTPLWTISPGYCPTLKSSDSIRA